MGNSQLTSRATDVLAPRKRPTQSRSNFTVEVILEAAAHILEDEGLDGYTTNNIATRAGVSIGSLYQYFPNKDAVTVALLKQEMTRLANDVSDALQLSEKIASLWRMIEVGVRYQLRRPRLSNLLDHEQSRLARLMPELNDAAPIRNELALFLRANWNLMGHTPESAASDVIGIVSALTDLAGQRGETDDAALARRIGAAVTGYLHSMESADNR